MTNMLSVLQMQVLKCEIVLTLLSLCVHNKTDQKQMPESETSRPYTIKNCVETG